VRKGIAKSAPFEIDVGGNDPFQSMSGRSFSERTRTFGLKYTQLTS
jgi:hypothetical protein